MRSESHWAKKLIPLAAGGANLMQMEERDRRLRGSSGWVGAARLRIVLEEMVAKGGKPISMSDEGRRGNARPKNIATLYAFPHRLLQAKTCR